MTIPLASQLYEPKRPSLFFCPPTQSALLDVYLQFHLFIEEDCHAVIELRQPSNRTAGLSNYTPIAPIICGRANRDHNVFLQPRLGRCPFGKLPTLNAPVRQITPTP